MANDAVVGTLKAILTADASSFKTEMRQAADAPKAVQASVSNLNKEVSKLTPQAERMVKAFSGDKLLYQANNLTSAVEKLGGAAKLTDAEMSRVNTTINAALAKYKALGQEAPAAMVALEKATKQSGGALSGLSSTLATLAPAIAGAFSVGAIVSFGKSVVDFAGHINDLSAETGVGVERIQALNLVGAKVGLTFDDVATSIERLSKNLDGGNPAAVKAMDRLGLSIDRIKSLSPDQAFIEIGEAAARIQDPMERNAILIELFGRSGAKMGRIFAENLGQIVDEAEHGGGVISKELIDKADEFGDRWDVATIVVKARLVQLFDWMAGAVTARQKDIVDLNRQIADQMNHMAPGAPGLFTTPRGAFTPAIPPGALSDLNNYTQQLELQKRVASQLAAAHGAELLAADKLGVSQEVLAERYGVGTTALKLAIEQVNASAKAATDAVPAWKALADAEDAVLAASQFAAGNAFNKALGAPGLFRSTLQEPTTDLPSKRVAEMQSMAQMFGGWANNAVGSIRRVGDEMSRLQQAVTSDFESMSQGISDGLAAAFLPFGGVSKEAKRAAEQAKQHYQELKSNGKASAQEIGQAYQDMLDAQDRATRTWKDRMIGVWQALSRGITNILGDVLNKFVGGFLSKALGAVADAFGAKALSRVIGGVAGTAATAATAAASTGAVAATAAGETAVTASTVTAGGGLAGSLGAFFTNPWTIAAGAAIVSGLLLARHFGKDAVNKPRDQFLITNFGGPTAQDGADRLAAQLTAWGQGDGGGPLMAALLGARKNLDAFHSIERAIADFFKVHGKPIQTFHLGGMVPGNGEVPALLLGGERVLNRQEAQAWNGKPVVINHYTTLHVEGMLSADNIEEIRRKHLVPLEQKARLLNTDFINTTLAPGASR